MPLNLNRPKLYPYLYIGIILLQVGCGSREPTIAPPGYIPYVSKEPFHILVSDKFPNDRSMMLLSTSNQIAFRMDDEIDRGEAAVSLPGVDFNVILSKDNKPEELMLSLSSPGHPTIVYRDINLDGMWDIMIVPATNKKFIFIDSHWLPVDKFQGRLPSIEADTLQGNYVFDTNKGQWVHK